MENRNANDDVRAIRSFLISSFEGKLIQYIGRLRGHNNHKVIIDYRDSQIPFLERQFKQRQRVYKKLLTRTRTPNQ